MLTEVRGVAAELKNFSVYNGQQLSFLMSVLVANFLRDTHEASPESLGSALLAIEDTKLEFIRRILNPNKIQAAFEAGQIGGDPYDL
jgi:hypothetical protein